MLAQPMVSTQQVNFDLSSDNSTHPMNDH